jgi:arylsulfatase A-like enzyme
MQRLISTLLPIALLSSFLWGAGPLHGAAQETPNILLVLVDDLGWHDLACYGSTLYETPNIDRLAASGVRFKQAYAAYPRCVPSRFALMTGKHPARFQGRRDGLKILPGRDRTVGQAFQDSGYTTFYCGKWHLGQGNSGPSANGFTRTIAAGAAGATRSHFAPYNKARRGKGGSQEKAEVPDLTDAPEGEYLTDRLTMETVNFIRAHRDQSFFAVLAHYAVHTPIEARDSATGYYQRKLNSRDMPEVILEPESAGENLRVQNNPAYAAMIQSVDEGVGRLMGLLTELDIDGRTIVVLTSDHGGLSARGNQRELATSNRPLRAGKGHLYEGGLRVPLIVRWPGVTRDGATTDAVVTGTDLLPSLLDMAALPTRPAEDLDGLSWAPFLQGSHQEPTRAVFWHNPAPRPMSTGDWFSSATRQGPLKLLEFPEQRRVELYDLVRDMGEANNLAEERPKDTERLLKQLHQWQRAVGAAPPKQETN